MPALLKAHPKLDVGTFATGLNVWDRLEEWEDDGGRAARPPGRGEPDEAQRFLAMCLAAMPKREPQRAYAVPRPSPSSRANRRRSTTSCLRKRARALARRWAISRPPGSGRRRITRPSGSPPTPRTCNASSIRNRPGSSPTRMSGGKNRHPQGPRKLSLPSQHAGSLWPPEGGRPAGRTSCRAHFALGPASRDGDMVGGDFPSWILSLFNGAGSMASSPPLTAVAWPHRPARRMHLFRLPALQALLHRELGARPQCFNGHRQPCPGHASGRCRLCAGVATTRKKKAPPAASSALSLMKAIIFSMPRIPLSPAISRPWKPPSCGAGCADPKPSAAVAVAWPTASAIFSAMTRARSCWMKSSAPPCAALLRFHAPHAGRTPGRPGRNILLTGSPAGAGAGRAHETGHTLETDCLPLIDGLAQASGNCGALIDLKRPMQRLANPCQQAR